MTRLITACDAFALTTLVLAWGIVMSAEVTHIQRIVARENPGRRLLFAFVLVAAAGSLVAVGYLLSLVGVANS